MVHKITSHRKENMKLELPQAIDYFTTAMTLEGKSPYTVLWHRKKLPAFAKFLQDSGHSLKVGDLAVEDARAFIKHLMERTTRCRAGTRCADAGGAGSGVSRGVVNLTTPATLLTAQGKPTRDLRPIPLLICMSGEGRVILVGKGVEWGVVQPTLTPVQALQVAPQPVRAVLERRPPPPRYWHRDDLPRGVPAAPSSASDRARNL
jgi:hypothetical protein